MHRTARGQEMVCHERFFFVVVSLTVSADFYFAE
jgi:hypothetical protein